MRQHFCQNCAYLIEFDGLERRELFRLKLLLRLNDIRLKNCRKSKLRIVSMVDCLKRRKKEIKLMRIIAAICQLSDHLFSLNSFSFSSSKKGKTKGVNYI